MKKFLIMLSLLGFAEFALAGETKNKIFDAEFEFDIDEYADKPCGKDWSEFEKKMCNLDRNSFIQLTFDDAKKINEMAQKCFDSDENSCEKYKTIWSKHQMVVDQIVIECFADNSIDSCYDFGRTMLMAKHIPRDKETDEFALEAFMHGCDLGSAKNCEQAGLLQRNVDENLSESFANKACEMDKNHCDAIALSTKNMELAKQMCEKKNAFACMNYSYLADKNGASIDENEIERIAHLYRKFCELDIDAKFEHLRAMFVLNTKFEEFKNLYKDGCFRDTIVGVNKIF